MLRRALSFRLKSTVVSIDQLQPTSSVSVAALVLYLDRPKLRNECSKREESADHKRHTELARRSVRKDQCTADNADQNVERDEVARQPHRAKCTSEVHRSRGKVPA